VGGFASFSHSTAKASVNAEHVPALVLSASHPAMSFTPVHVDIVPVLVKSQFTFVVVGAGLSSFPPGDPS